MGDRITAVTSDELRPGAATPGISREIAVQSSAATLMRARAEARAATGWHHHAGHDVFGYVVRGAASFEFGAGGADRVDVPVGGMFHVPAWLVHRDVNPLDVPQEIILTLVGDGPLVVNVEGPPSGEPEISPR
jgi:uncharacterized RmlC-like cupin family protein